MAVADLATAVMLVASAIVVLRFRLSSTWLIVLGAGVAMIRAVLPAP